MLLSFRDVLPLVQFNRRELTALSVPQTPNMYLYFPYLRFPSLRTGICVFHTYIFHPCKFIPTFAILAFSILQESRNFILPISILAFSSTSTFSDPDYIASCNTVSASRTHTRLLHPLTPLPHLLCYRRLINITVGLRQATKVDSRLKAYSTSFRCLCIEHTTSSYIDHRPKQGPRIMAAGEKHGEEKHSLSQRWINSDPGNVQ